MQLLIAHKDAATRAAFTTAIADGQGGDLHAETGDAGSALSPVRFQAVHLQPAYADLPRRPAPG
jgi:hypothetical protein